MPAAVAGAGRGRADEWCIAQTTNERRGVRAPAPSPPRTRSGPRGCCPPRTGTRSPAPDGNASAAAGGCADAGRDLASGCGPAPGLIARRRRPSKSKPPGRRGERSLDRPTRRSARKGKKSQSAVIPRPLPRRYACARACVSACVGVRACARVRAWVYGRACACAIVCGLLL